MSETLMDLTPEEIKQARYGLEACDQALKLLERCRRAGRNCDEQIKQVKETANLLMGYLREFGNEVTAQAS